MRSVGRSGGGAGGTDRRSDGKAKQQMKHGDGTHGDGMGGGMRDDGLGGGMRDDDLDGGMRDDDLNGDPKRRDRTHGDRTHRDLTAHDLTHATPVERDIALLLADAAREVEVGMAPYQAVVRGGRRRRARRWVVAAAAAVVIAGTTGTLALAGAPGGGDGGGRVVPAATPATPEARRMHEPWRSTLAEGRDQGTVWRVAIDVWEAPRDRGEAARQLAAAGLFGDVPTGVDGAADLVGKSWHFVHLTVGEDRTVTVLDGEADPFSGTDLEAYATVLPTGDGETGGEGGDEGRGGEGAGDASKRLVIGQVAPTAQEVRVTWSDGTSVDVRRNRDDGWHADLRNPRIVHPKGALASWFVALAPEGVEYESAKVTG
ncbi:hypothetical protein PV379_37380 [Streptomyces caniscabiei]|uniref:hypothetical protein n=1 Tax=Streptomyces caniscabiei TaxID=2746961 RepID=UPI0029A76BD1|nr:hypothetical protein [Streptomyces caniscabiei]MDX2598989.1 hypothetical protein [Streptomyces caniscabiei]MDX2736459.1 hypothetical protein [Streptomyces caniscabiei]MDX2782939.1 hypothetical protein [Streptomyces caniscabiei]